MLIQRTMPGVMAALRGVWPNGRPGRSRRGSAGRALEGIGRPAHQAAQPRRTPVALDLRRDALLESADSPEESLCLARGGVAALPALISARPPIAGESLDEGAEGESAQRDEQVIHGAAAIQGWSSQC